ncbi:MAG: tetratricopeptide repeat protein [Rhodothermales bacterium]
MANDQDTARPGDRIGNRYEVMSILGKGGFGVVYHARSLEHGREFALKTYLKSSLDRRAITRFRQESEIWIALGAHPYLVQAYFADEIDGRLYVGMELISAGPLGYNDLDKILKNASPGLDQWLRWGVQLSHGMEYAGLRGIRAHRDLKPANVMINEAGDVKINDFGLATQPVASLGETPDTRLEENKKLFRGQTMHGIGFGTPTHMPPEQFENAATCDARSDIYAVGVILYQAMTGQLPVTLAWPTETTLENRLRFWNEMEKAHRRFEVPKLGTPLDHVLRRCMATEPDGRYPNFAALRADLEQVQREQGFSLVPPPVVRPLSPKGWLSRGRSLARIGRYPQAIHAFSRALEGDPSDELSLLGKADALLALGQPASAQPVYESLLESQPDHAEAHVGKARCMYMRGYHRMALDLFDRAVELDPSLPQSWVHRGVLLRSMGTYEEAMESLEEALALAPGDVESLTAKAALLASMGEVSDALKLFERALSINPLHTPAARGQVICLVRLGRYKRALSLFRQLDRAGDLQPRHHLAWIEALARSGQAGLALARLDEMSVPEVEEEALRMRAQILVDLKRLDEALEAWKRIKPEDRDTVLSVQGQILYLLCGQEASALALSGKDLPAHGHMDYAYAAVGGAALRLGQDERALDTIKQGLKQHPDSALLHYNLGVAYSLLNRSEEASITFSTAARMTHGKGAIGGAALFNAEMLSHLHAKGLPAVFPGGFRSISEEPQQILSDDVLPSQPVSTLRIQANGWHPRYRLPHLRPTFYLFPRYLPADLAG